jgi:hypothetical protein
MVRKEWLTIKRDVHHGRSVWSEVDGARPNVSPADALAQLEHSHRSCARPDSKPTEAVMTARESRMSWQDVLSRRKLRIAEDDHCD